MTDKCVVCGENEPDIDFETCEECKDDLFDCLGGRLITYDRISAWAANRAREKLLKNRLRKYHICAIGNPA